MGGPRPQPATACARREPSARPPGAACQRGGAAPPIGRPLSNVRAYVLDAGLEPVAPGVPGELFIAGTAIVCIDRAARHLEVDSVLTTNVAGSTAGVRHLIEHGDRRKAFNYLRRAVRRDRFVKRTTAQLYNRTTSIVTGVDGRDFNSGFKAMRRDVAASLELYGELHRYIPVLADRGYRTVPCDPDELDAQGCNVLAVRPGVVVMADSAPSTRSALERAGVEVHTYTATETNKGDGGPTCLTRPVLRG